MTDIKPGDLPDQPAPELTGSGRAEAHIAETQRHIRVLASVVALILLAMGSVSTVFSVRSDLAAGEARDQVIYCTTPGPLNPETNDGKTGHECFDRSRTRSNEVVVIVADEVDRRSCVRIREALTIALGRNVTFACDPIPPAEENP